MVLHSKSEDVIHGHGSFTEKQLQELYPKLRRYCQFLAQSSWDGEEIMQEALVRAWRHYRFQAELSQALLHKIAQNVWIDMVRKRGQESLEEIPDHGYDGSKQMETRLEMIEKLMNHLTPKQAVMFVLKEGFQFQLSEIAELLNTTETAVKATIYRVNQRLEKPATLDEPNPLIKQYWEQEEYELMERIFHETFITQDPTILITSIPLIRSLGKASIPTCSMLPSHFLAPSTTLCMAA